MHIVTEAQFKAEVEPLLRQVFLHDNYLQKPFSANVVERRIIYPCKYYVESISTSAIVAAASQVGDEGCYIYRLWGSGSSGTVCCYVPLIEFVDGYAGVPGSNKLIGVRLGMNVYGEEVCIFSPQGTWGIMTTTEWFGLLGCVPSFLQVLQQLTPELDEQVYNFLEHLRLLNVDLGMGSNISQNEWLNDWLPDLLAHVYGKEQGTQVLGQFVRSPVGCWASF